MGSIAKEFFDAFQLGSGKRTIATVDTDGVALGAIRVRLYVNHNKAVINPRSLRKGLGRRLVDVDTELQTLTSVGHELRRELLLIKEQQRKFSASDDSL